MPEGEQAAATANSFLLDVLEQSDSRDATLVFDACKTLAAVAATLGRNALHDKSAEVIRRVRSWAVWLDQHSVLTALVEQLAERGASSQILELLDGLDTRGLGLSLYENVIIAAVARTGDVEGAGKVLKALKPNGDLPILDRLKELTTGAPMSSEEMTETTAQLLWLASKVAARNGDKERAELLSHQAFAAVMKLVEAHRRPGDGESAQDQFRRASMLAQAARQLAEMGFVERAEEAFSLAASYYHSAEESWDTWRFVWVGVRQTRDEEVGDQDASYVSRIIRRCDYVEGFAHSRHLEAVQTHVEAVMNDARLIERVHSKDRALQRIARMLGYVGKWAEARDVVDSMHDNRDYTAVDVLESVISSVLATGATPAVGRNEDLMDIVHLGCQSLNGAIRTLAILDDGLFPFDAAVARSLDALVATVTARANAIVSASTEHTA